MNPVYIIYSLFDEEEEARNVCQTLLQEGLIACANCLSPSTSYYLWEGEPQTTVEYPVIFKTSATHVKAAIDRIATLHSYNVPAILSWPVTNSHGPFADWVAAQNS